jgi:putative ABC transport system substrate-binding protein
MIQRRDFITFLGGAAAAWPLAARGQQGGRLRRVGVLMALAPSDPEARLRATAFENGLRNLGWVEGRNLRIGYRWAPGEADVLRTQAAELVASAPDVILCIQAQASDRSVPLAEKLDEVEHLQFEYCRFRILVTTVSAKSLSVNFDREIRREDIEPSAPSLFVGAEKKIGVALLRFLVSRRPHRLRRDLQRATAP